MKILSAFVLSFVLVLAACNTDSPQAESETNTTAAETKESVEFSSEVKGPSFTLKGNIQNATPDMKVFVDQKTVESTKILASTPVDAAGAFELLVPMESEGVFRLRLGAKMIYFYGRPDATLTLQVDNNQIDGYTFEGSEESMTMKSIDQMSTPKALESFINSSENALLSWYAVTNLDFVKHLKTHQKVKEQLETQMPQSPYTRQYSLRVAQISQKIAAQPVKQGEPAPNIALKNPQGQVVELKDLKGKVVLIDFWASWCRPCRHNNPEVVALYERFKKKGFTVYSVSLDGLDDRRLAALQSNNDLIQQQLTQQKQKWVQAIKQDKLSWKYHVSDLRGWSSSAARLYGVNAIPKTFLLDRQGNIAAMNLRGAQLEQKVKELL